MSKARVILPVILVAAAVGGGAVWLSRGDEPADDRLVASGTVEATDAQLGFQVGGRLTTVHPREGDDVEAGDELASLDRSEAEARAQQAEARLEAARARLAELESGFRPEEIGQARAALAAARDQLADAERDLERSRTLFEGGAVPREALDKATAQRDVASAQVEQAEQQLKLLRSGARPEQLAAQRAQVSLAEAEVRTVRVALDDRVLRAPFAGVVTVRHREPGETVAPGAAVLTLLDRSDRWVRIYVPEDRLGRVAIGAPAQIRSDSFPDRRVPGEVFFLASEAEFTPKNVQTQEERVRLVYAVKVRVTGDPEHRLKPGMPVDVELETEAGGSGG